MKKKLALIGLGNLSPKLSPALTDNSHVEVIAICDKNSQAIGRYMYGDAPFFTDYHSLLQLNPDYVYVATNPKTHYEITKYFLNNGVSVLCDKPPTQSFEEYLSLKEAAHNKGVSFEVVYHFRYSHEILWLKKHLKQFGKLMFASARFDDPYCKDDTILPGRELLMGAWMDSGSNILGAWSFLFPDIDPQNANASMTLDSIYNIPIQTVSSFQWDQTLFSIAISWKNNTRNKEMVFAFEKSVVYIDFPNQEIYVNGKLVLKNYDIQSTAGHYSNFFNEFETFRQDKTGENVVKLLYNFP